jgi:energy-coupling factor transporter ATP-binding protein EcfA2
MRITGLQIKNFKRFTDLTIEAIPKEAKLVLLIGSNGSGKSSIFDALDFLAKPYRGEGIDALYYTKNGLQPEVGITFDDLSKIDSTNHDAQVQNKLRKFIGRSSIRIVPRISNNGNIDIIKNNRDAPASFIDQDTRFNNDLFMYIQEIDNALREPVFRGKSADTLKIFHDFINPLNTSLINILGGDASTTIQIVEFQNATTQSSGKLIFEKGNSKINYDLLSHGEKQVVTLLLNFIVRRSYYQDAIIFIDEMDCHLNTVLQYRLLEEIVTIWIPDTAQLWTASHALGFIDFARKSDHASILDFDLLNFDIPQTITPQTKDSLEVYEVAIPKIMLFDILKGKKLVVCENQNDEYYNLLQIPDTIFVGLKDSRDVFLNVKRDTRYHSLRDRDFLNDSEISKVKAAYPNHHVLKYYDFENYLYHPDNIEQLQMEGFDKKAYLLEIVKQKNEKIHYILATLTSSRQNYEEFKTDSKLRDKGIEDIIEDFKSDEFERFYKYFDMKEQFNKSSLAALNLSKERLVQTKWFKDKIEEILTN